MKSYLIILFLVICFKSNAQFTQLLWSDEFDGPSINKTNWIFETGNNNGWGNNELEYYTNRADNATIRDGSLLIIAKKETYGGKNYTSARMKTQGLRSFTYGKIEARIKAPVGQGIWPAFWMLGNSINQSGVGWPKCGEIDILEHINSVPVVNGTIHWDNNGHVQYGKTATCDVRQFHVYGIEWDSNAIKWFVDGKKYGEASIANNINSTDEFHKPFFLLLNLAVGGNWPGSPDGTTVFPDTMFVDYVRVYGLTTGSSGVKLDNEKTSLSHSSPNPFYQTANISFEIPEKSLVILKIFNSTGKEMTTLESQQLAAGNYQRQWDASGFPSGIYYYRLQAGDIVETKKLMLQK